MADPFALSIYHDDLTRIVQSVFGTMMELEVTPVPAPWVHSSDAIAAAVHFVGEWRGATLVETGGPQARHFAHKFMGIPIPPAIDDDVRDVMGELANMVAGNLKSLLPHGVDISVPSVVEGSDYSLRISHGNLVEQAHFTSVAGDFCITVVESLPRI